VFALTSSLAYQNRLFSSRPGPCKDLVSPGLCEFIFLSLVFGTKAQLLESQRASYFSTPCLYSNCITIFIGGDG